MTKTDATTADPAARGCLRQGWMMILGFLSLGIALESFHLFKLPSYVEVELRRELWTLAHAHGTLFGLVNVAFALSAARLLPDPTKRRTAGRLLRVGSLLLPFGFLFGGIGAAEGDPSLSIGLVPIGAIAILASVAMLLLGRRAG